MGLTDIAAFRNVARSLGSLAILAIVSFFYTVQAEAGQVSLGWDDNIESILGGYRVYYGLASRTYTANVDVGYKTSYTVSNLQDGNTYYFAVKAYAIGGLISSDFSNEVSITASSSSGGGGGGEGGSNAGLVGAYNFEEASGTTVVDASGQGNTGTISGATRITQGRFGKALSFDGNDWVTINDATPLDLTGKMTLEAWVYPTAVPSYWSTIMHKEVDRYYLMAGSDGGGGPATGGTYSTGMKTVVAPAPLAANTWTHLAATYDGATIRLYVNGTNVASQVPNAPLTVSASGLRIGGSAAYMEFFKGRIDEIRIYNRALSATEIQTDMNQSVATSSPPATLVRAKTIGPVADSNPQGKAEAFQTTSVVTGMVTRLSVYVDSSSTATKVVAGLYMDNNGHPGTLLAKGTLTSPKAGRWNTVALRAKLLTAGSKYWIAILGPSGDLQFRAAAARTSQPSETSAQTTLTTLPRTWSTGSTSYQGPVSAYGAGY